MRKVIFLDRDGVINKERGKYTFKITDFEINEGVFDFLKIAQNKGYEFVVITNQGGISKKIYNHKDVNIVHEFMLTKFKQVGIDILSIYYCPHHSENENCICRKPKSQLLEKSIARFSIDKSLSFFIGDSERDVEAAKNVGMKGIKIESNSNLMQLKNNLI